MTKLDITKIQGLIPSGIGNTRKVIYETLLAWEQENGSQYDFLSYQGTQKLNTAINFGAYKHPEKFDDLVRVWWGGELPRYWEAENAFVRIITSNEDAHYAEAHEVVSYGRVREYENYRYENPEASHADAMEYVKTAHFHTYTEKTSGSRNAVLGTHDLTTTHTCECGHSYETRSVNNWSGD